MDLLSRLHTDRQTDSRTDGHLEVVCMYIEMFSDVCNYIPFMPSRVFKFHIYDEVRPCLIVVISVWCHGSISSVSTSS